MAYAVIELLTLNFALNPPFRQTLVICCPFLLSVSERWKKHTLLQALVCAVALCGLQMCVLVCWLIHYIFNISANSSNDEIPLMSAVSIQSIPPAGK